MTDEIYLKLAQTVHNFVKNDGKSNYPIQGISFYRHSKPAHFLPCMQPLGMVIAVQGDKDIYFNNQKIHYRVGEILFAGADLSGFSYVSNASITKPFLGIAIEFDLSLLLEMAAHIQKTPHSKTPKAILHTVKADVGILDCIYRLLHVQANLDSNLIKQLTRLYYQELALRLLSAYPDICQLLTSGSVIANIIHIMSYLKEHYKEPININELAKKAHMSPSSFRKHFRSIAGLSPLQYQKQLRLQKARNLILNDNLSISQAAHQVGYHSLSQFSREYQRFFATTAQADKKTAYYKK